VQIFRSDDEQLTHLKTSSEASEEKIDQQTEHFNDLNRLHLRNEHRRSSSHLFNHLTVSIHLLCFDLIRSQRKTRFQAEKKCDIVLYEKHSNSSDSDHFRDLQKHRRCNSERWTLSVLDSSTARHDVRMMILKQSKRRRTLFRRRKFDVLIESI
jgi:hypothetical protein